MWSFFFPPRFYLKAYTCARRLAVHLQCRHSRHCRGYFFHYRFAQFCDLRASSSSIWSRSCGSYSCSHG